MTVQLNNGGGESSWRRGDAVRRLGRAVRHNQPCSWRTSAPANGPSHSRCSPAASLGSDLAPGMDPQPPWEMVFHSCHGQEGSAQQQRLGAHMVNSCTQISSSCCNGSGSFRKLLALIKDSMGWRIYSPPPHKLIKHLIKLQIKNPHTLFSSVKLADGCFQPWVSLRVSWRWECSCIKRLLGKIHHFISYHSPHLGAASILSQSLKYLPSMSGM